METKKFQQVCFLSLFLCAPSWIKEPRSYLEVMEGWNWTETEFDFSYLQFNGTMQLSYNKVCNFRI